MSDQQSSRGSIVALPVPKALRPQVASLSGRAIEPRGGETKMGLLPGAIGGPILNRHLRERLYINQWSQKVITFGNDFSKRIEWSVGPLLISTPWQSRTLLLSVNQINWDNSLDKNNTKKNYGGGILSWNLKVYQSSNMRNSKPFSLNSSNLNSIHICVGGQN